MYDDLIYDVEDNVGVITLNRPAVRNALRRQTYTELETVIRAATARCLVITGTDPAFCAGDDMNEIMTGESPTDLLEAGALTPAADAFLHSDIPVIAAVNGAAIGWGMEIALMADLRIASEKAVFGEAFVLRGLCCDVAGIGRLAQLVGRERAAELLFTGETIDAATAQRIGLVGRVVPHQELLEEARRLAHRIAENPPRAVSAIKAGLRRALDPDWHDLGPWVTQTLAELFATADHREAVAAYQQKRTPRFTGD